MTVCDLAPKQQAILMFRCTILSDCFRDYLRTIELQTPRKRSVPPFINAQFWLLKVKVPDLLDLKDWRKITSQA